MIKFAHLSGKAQSKPRVPAPRKLLGSPTVVGETLYVADTGGRVLDSDLVAIPGLYAAGELIGGLFYFNYPGGAGLMSGAVFGRLAGDAAGQRAIGTNQPD